jgi:hypothetical protein
LGVDSGKGLIGVHAATDNFYDWPEGASMVGGLFSGHPWGGGGTWAFKIDEPDHPLTRAFGGKGFKLRDEIYQFKDPYARNDRRVLLSLDLSDKDTGDVAERLRGVTETCIVPRDARALADAVSAILLRRERSNGRLRVREVDASHIADELAHLYLETVALSTPGKISAWNTTLSSQR